MSVFLGRNFSLGCRQAPSSECTAVCSPMSSPIGSCNAPTTRAQGLKEKFSREELIAVLPTGFFLIKEQAQFLRSLVSTAVGREVPSSR